MRRRWKKAALIAAMIVSTTISSERFGHAENSESTEAEYIGEVEQEEISGNQETQEEFAASEDGTEENETEENGLEENESEEAGFEELFSEEEIEEFASKKTFWERFFRMRKLQMIWYLYMQYRKILFRKVLLCVSGQMALLLSLWEISLIAANMPSLDGMQIRR